MSGSRRNAVESAIDEIASLNRNIAAPPTEDEYMSSRAPKLSAAEKRRKGELLRQKVITLKWFITDFRNALY